MAFRGIDEVQAALARSAEELVEPLTGQPGESSWEQRLSRLTQAATDNVPGADMVGLTLQYRSGALRSYGQTGSDVLELDRLQVELEQGPCLDAIQVGTSEVIQVRDFAEEARWPQFAAAAVQRGVQSLVSYAMAPSQGIPGAINFYSRSADAFDSTARVIGQAFAMQAGVAMYGASEIDGLERALETRDVIGQAKGILMERHHVEAVRAFDMLVNASQDTNMKLVDVARWLTADVGAKPTR